MPGNPRTISDAALARLAESIRRDPEFMRLRPIVIDADGIVIGGNQRLRACSEILGMTDLPDGWVIRADNLTEEQRRRFTLVDNVQAGEWDMGALAEGYADMDLGAMGITMPEAEPDAEPEEDDDPVREQGVFALREDAIFPASNRWGIPDLDPDMCADVPAPTSCWTGGPPKSDGQLMLFGSNAIPSDVRDAVLAFYVDDWRFEAVWSKAVQEIDRLRGMGFAAIVAPDFSVWRDDPAAVQLWNIYRSRWVARYWQACGVKVVPSLNWSDERSYEFAFLGLPVGAPVVSCQCRTTRSRKGTEYFLRGLSRAIETLKPRSVWIYGGSEHRERLEPSLPDCCDYAWLESRTQARRKEGLR